MSKCRIIDKGSYDGPNRVEKKRKSWDYKKTEHNGIRQWYKLTKELVNIEMVCKINKNLSERVGTKKKR